LRLIAINGVLFGVLKCQARQKRHWPTLDKTSELSTDTALYPLSTKTYSEIPDEHLKRAIREKNTPNPTSRLEKSGVVKNRRSFS
jgi:hypothetical protein